MQIPQMGQHRSARAKRIASLQTNRNAADDAHTRRARRSQSPAPAKTEAINSHGNVVAAAAKPIDPKMIMPAGFMFSRGGIWFNPQGEGTKPFHVCGIFDVVAQTRDDYSKDWGLWLKWQDPDGREHNWAMPLALLAGDGGEIRATLLHGGLAIAPSKTARAKFMELLAGLKIDARARAVHTVGWNGSAFVLPDRTIGDTPENRVIYQGTDAFDHAYLCMGDLAGWRDNVARFGVGNSRLVLAFSAGFVGPLLLLLGEEGGGINLRGPSSIGKSTTLFASCSIWGSPRYVRQWRATANGLEGVCIQHNQTFLCLDELAQLDPREARSVAYLISNGVGKARASRTGLLRSPAQWRVFFLSTGEISLDDLAARDLRGGARSGAGQEIRILDVEADAGSGLGLFENLHGHATADALARKIKENAGLFYGIAGPIFVERVASDRDAITSALKNDIGAFLGKHLPPRSNGQVARAGHRFALIAAAGELAVRLDILPFTPGEASAAAATIFRQWLFNRGGVGAAEDREAIAKVRGFLEMHGSSRFEAVDDDDDAPRIINRAGFWRESDKGREFLFLPETWKTEVCTGLDASRVAKVLADRGLLRRDAGGKNSVSITLPAGIGKTRCYAINAAIFDVDISV